MAILLRRIFLPLPQKINAGSNPGLTREIDLDERAAI
jgi:hypothetical protein